MKRKKAIYRFDLTKQIEEIRAGAWVNARRLGFERITDLRRARKRFGGCSYVQMQKRGEVSLCSAVSSILNALDFCRELNSRVDDLMELGGVFNLRAREAIEKIAAEVATVNRAA